MSNSIFTKEDGRILESEMRVLKSGLESIMSKFKSEMIAWIVGLLFAQTAIMVSIIKFVH